MEFNRRRRETWGRGLTWSPTIIEADVVLSNGNRTATAGSGNVSYQPGASAKVAATAGIKHYFEVRLDVLGTPGSTAVGLANASNTYVSGQYLGITNNAIGYFDDGTVIRNNATVTTLAVPVVGNTICVAFTSGGQVWFGVNGVFSGNPVAGTGGVDISTLGDVFPAYSLQGAGVTKVTAKSVFSFTAPAGFLGYQ